MQLAPDTRLTRNEAPAALKRAGYQVTASTLATFAHRGTGPRYAVFGNRAVYTWADLLDWAQSRVTHPTTRAA